MLSNMEVVNMDERDIDYVLANPWEVSKDELNAFGIECWNWKMTVRTLWVNSKYASALRLNDATVAILGGYLTDDGIWRTWFLASDLFPLHAKDATKTTRKFLREAFKRETPAQVISITASAREDAENWFRLIGFARAPEYDYHKSGRHFRGFSMKG